MSKYVILQFTQGTLKLWISNWLATWVASRQAAFMFYASIQRMVVRGVMFFLSVCPSDRPTVLVFQT